MMKFHVINLIRRGEITHVPVDVAELLKRVKEYEDRGETAPRYPIENEQMLGRPWSSVQELAERLALLAPDFDLDVGPCEKLTDRGRRFLLAIPGWFGMDGSENEEPTRTSIRQTKHKLNHQLGDPPAREFASR
jgi:hypothetical protein